MIEDKLSHDERLRLECLAQAIAAQAALGSRAVQGIPERAVEFEKYVRGATK